MTRGKLIPKIGPGRSVRERKIGSVRSLAVDDLQILTEKRTRPAAARFRDPHHNVARLIAAGLRLPEVAKRTGYSIGRVTMLHGDPAFQELIAYYRKLVDQTFLMATDDYFELLTSNMVKAERMIADKLDTADFDGETLPVRDLATISRDAADRLGYGKKQTTVNVNVDFAAQLERAIKRSGKVIESTADGPRALGSVGSSPPSSPVAQPTPVSSGLRRLA